MLSEGIQTIGEGLLEVAEERLQGLLVKEDFNEIYDVEQTPFARGKFAAVRRAIHKKSGLHFAAKFLKRRRRAQSSDKEIRHEIAVLILCSGCDNIVNLNAVHETRSDTALLLELATGGELQAILDEEGSLTEAQTRICMRQVLKALQFLHKRSIAHLDLKPQNILLNGKRVEDGLKLCDFGISRVIENGSKIREILGTPDYVAPEVLQYEPLSLLTDIWSVGVLTYVLLSGCSPFGGDTKQETFLNISQCDLTFPDELFDGVSECAIDFIKSTLKIKPSDRLSALDCLEHIWLREDSPFSGCTYLTTPNKSIIGVDATTNATSNSLNASSSPAKQTNGSYSNRNHSNSVSDTPQSDTENDEDYGIEAKDENTHNSRNSRYHQNGHTYQRNRSNGSGSSFCENGSSGNVSTLKYKNAISSPKSNEINITAATTPSHDSHHDDKENFLTPTTTNNVSGSCCSPTTTNLSFNSGKLVGFVTRNSYSGGSSDQFAAAIKSVKQLNSKQTNISNKYGGSKIITKTNSDSCTLVKNLQNSSRNGTDYDVVHVHNSTLRLSASSSISRSQVMTITTLPTSCTSATPTGSGSSSIKTPVQTNPVTGSSVTPKPATICLFPDAPTTPKVIRKAPSESPKSVKALVKKFQPEASNDEEQHQDLDDLDDSKKYLKGSNGNSGEEGNGSRSFKTTCVFCLTCAGPGCRHSGRNHTSKTATSATASMSLDQGIIC